MSHGTRATDSSTLKKVVVDGVSQKKNNVLVLHFFLDRTSQKRSFRVLDLRKEMASNKEEADSADPPAQVDSSQSEKIDNFDSMSFEKLKEEILSTLALIEEKVPILSQTVSSLEPSDLNKGKMVRMIRKMSQILADLEMTDQESLE